MAFGKPIDIHQETEADLSLAPDRAITRCTGVFPNGTEFRFRDGVLQVKGVAAPDFADANPSEKIQMRTALEKQFGARRIEIDEYGRFILRDTPGPSAVDKFAQGFREKIYDYTAAGNLAQAQELGIASFIRGKVDAAMESRPDIEAEVRHRFAGPVNLNEMIRLSFDLATDEAQQKAIAAAFVKKEKLVEQIVRRVRAGEDRDSVLTSVRKDIEHTGRYERAPREVAQIMDIATEAARAAYNKSLDKEQAKRDKRNSWNRRFAKVPFTPQREWNSVLDKFQIISTIRLLEQTGVDGDTAWNQIEDFLHEAGVDHSDEVTDYAFSMFGNEAFRAKLQKKFITAKNIDATVAMALRAGQTKASVEASLKADFDADGRTDAEVNELINHAFERAEQHELKMNMKSDLKSFLPFTDERGWDDYLTDHGIFTRVRHAKQAGMDDESLRAELMTDPNILHHPKQQAILEYAIRWGDNRFMLNKVASRIVKKRKLGEEVFRLQQAGTAEANIRTALRRMLDADTNSDEVDAVMESAFASAGSIRNWEKIKDISYRDRIQNAKDLASFVSGGVRNTIIPGITNAPEKVWNFTKKIPGALWHELLHPSDTTKKVAKYSAFGLAIAGISTAAVGVGALALGAYGLKKAAPLVFNVGKHVVTDGATLVGAVAKTAIVNPIKATGRIVSSPFKRGYQAARWATNYVSKPNVKKPKGWLKPFTWMNNKIKGAWYRSKQATLALAAGSLFSIYGAGEGIANAASKDLLGLDAEIPELAIFHAPSGHGGHGGHGGDHGHDAGHGGDHGGDHGEDHGHGAAHGGGHH